MDSTGASIAGIVPQLLDRKRYNDDGTGGMHLYIPWWAYDQQLDFPRGYHFEMGGGMRMPGYGFMGGIHNFNNLFADRDGNMRASGGGYGKKLKDDYRRYYGAFIGFSGRGEMIARESNYCEIDPSVVDQYGIPVLRFHVKWSDAEYLQVKHMQETAREIIHSLGGTPLGAMPTKEEGYGISGPGRIIHEVGVARMGNDPKTSVLNAHCQSHDVKNLFVADAAPFVSQAHKNTTWTILALAMRTSEHIAEEWKKGNI